jgi:hypothetical protein
VPTTAPNRRRPRPPRRQARADALDEVDGGLEGSGVFDVECAGQAEPGPAGAEHRLGAYKPLSAPVIFERR